MFTLKNVTLAYGNSIILNNESLCFAAPSTAIIGKNGAGKSTLLNALAGLIKPQFGEIELNGVPVREKQAKNEIGYVPQKDIVFDDLSVYDNLVFWASASNINGKKNILSNCVVEMLELNGIIKQKVKKLSGGTKRRLSIACGIMHNPSCLILDEPLTGLDAETSDRLLLHFKALLRQGKLIIMTSHNANELKSLCDEFYNINNAHITRLDALAESGHMRNCQII